MPALVHGLRPLGLAMSLLAVPTRSYSAPPPKESAAAAQLPSSFRWSSSGKLISPKPDASHSVVSVKDPTAVRANGKWHVFMTTANTAGSWSLAYTSFTPQSWSAPRTFQNAAPSGTLDYWTICDSAMCYLFSADDNGHVYRSETTVGEFPGGFRNTRLVLQDSKFALFEGGAVYRVQGTNTYLLLWESIGGDGRRYYRSFTAQGLTGQWQPLAATEANPFARATNVTFPSGAWTRDISHGELVRAGNDQTMTINPCRLQFLYQGLNPSAGGDYAQLPYRLGLLTQTNSS
ncbi:non-reducing end alpha-L-arabinofuranosidase family hydrolase [Streptomyces sp. NBC_00258]|nr:non-reducing end alpha-L-arabinofuranosidase family hydrolase [Streptomyces sp. NBC_00258]